MFVLYCSCLVSKCLKSKTKIEQLLLFVSDLLQLKIKMYIKALLLDFIHKKCKDKNKFTNYVTNYVFCKQITLKYLNIM